MKPSTLQNILDEALTHGKHHPGCAFASALRAGQHLPDNHPRKPKQLPNISICNCWRKKAIRMLKAIRVSNPSVLEGDSDE
jgi:hypothetical protein